MMTAAAGVGAVPVGSAVEGEGVGAGAGVDAAAGGAVLVLDDCVVAQKVSVYEDGLGVAWLRMRKQNFVSG